jgi:hypothetical protein
MTKNRDVISCHIHKARIMKKAELVFFVAAILVIQGCSLADSPDLQTGEEAPPGPLK